MIIRSRSPLRMSFAGGGTELSPYIDSHGGLVLSATINMYAHCTIETRHDGCFQLESADGKQRTNFDSLEKVKFQKCGSFTKILAACIQTFSEDNHLKLNNGLNISTYTDAPAGSGLGTSSTLTTSIISALDNYLDLNLSPYDIASTSHYIEREKLGLHGGLQDHYSAAFGGINFIEFRNQNNVLVNPLRISERTVCELESSIILYYTGISRFSGQIISNQIDSLKSGDIPTEYYDKIKEFAVLAKEALLKDEIQQLGVILDEAWAHKKKLSSMISNDEIDEIYSQCKHLGCYGGKISGAGGGGFMILILDPVNRENIVSFLNTKGGYVVKPSVSEVGSYSWKS